MSAKAQNYINGRILDIQKQELDAAVVMLVSLPENVLIETTVTDSTGCTTLEKVEWICTVSLRLVE